MVIPAAEETRYARHGEVRIAFTDLGGAGGEPLLLIMGLAVSRFWWPPGLVDELVRRGFHVAAYDQRDAGQSTRFPDTGAASPIAAVLRRRSPAYTAEDMTDDAVAVLDALGWESAHLFGHSMGGQLAQPHRTAASRPGAQPHLFGLTARRRRPPGGGPVRARGHRGPAGPDEVPRGP